MVCIALLRVLVLCILVVWADGFQAMCSAGAGCDCDTTAVGSNCQYLCDGTDECKGSSLRCVGGDICNLECTGVSGCEGGHVECSNTKDCLTRCGQLDSCRGLIPDPNPPTAAGAAFGHYCSPAVQNCKTTCDGQNSCHSIVSRCEALKCGFICNGINSCTSTDHTAQPSGDSAYECKESSSCTDFKLKAVTGALSVNCHNVQACKGGSITCPDNQNCLIQCTHNQACSSLTLACPTNLPVGTTCTIQCTVDYACELMDASKLSGKITAVCLTPLSCHNDLKNYVYVPATDAPDTDAPDTNAPDTPAPDTPAPDTPAPDTPAPDTDAPDTPAPDTPAPDTPAPDTPAPDTDAPDTPAPDTDIPATLIPGTTYAPDTDAPDTPIPDTPAPDTDAPDTPIPDTLVPGTTHSPETPSPDTLAPRTSVPTSGPTCLSSKYQAKPGGSKSQVWCDANCPGAVCFTECQCRPTNCTTWVPSIASFNIGNITQGWCTAMCSGVGNDAYCVGKQGVLPLCECRNPPSLLQCADGSNCACSSNTDCVFRCSGAKECTRSDMVCGSGGAYCDMKCEGDLACLSSTYTCDTEAERCSVDCAGYMACKQLPSVTSPSMLCGPNAKSCAVNCDGSYSCEYSSIVCKSSTCDLSCKGQQGCSNVTHTCSGGACRAKCESPFSCQNTKFLWGQSRGSVTLECQDTLSCSGASLECPSGLDCVVECHGFKSCENLKAPGAKLLCLGHDSCAGAVGASMVATTSSFTCVGWVASDVGVLVFGDEPICQEVCLLPGSESFCDDFCKCTSVVQPVPEKPMATLSCTWTSVVSLMTDSWCIAVCGKSPQDARCQPGPRQVCDCSASGGASTPAPTTMRCAKWAGISVDDASCQLWCNRPEAVASAVCSEDMGVCACSSMAPEAIPMPCPPHEACNCQSCNVLCNSFKECEATSLRCGIGPCSVLCTDTASCRSATIGSDLSETLYTGCKGVLSCADQQLTCTKSTNFCHTECTGLLSCTSSTMECNSAACQLTCGAVASCFSTNHTCSSSSCSASCLSQDACLNATFFWGAASAVTSLDCTSTHSCKGSTLHCPLSGCSITCGGYESCMDMAVHCLIPGTCNVKCSGGRSCVGLSGGSVSCIGPGACEGGTVSECSRYKETVAGNELQLSNRCNAMCTYPETSTVCSSGEVQLCECVKKAECAGTWEPEQCGEWCGTDGNPTLCAGCKCKTGATPTPLVNGWVKIMKSVFRMKMRHHMGAFKKADFEAVVTSVLSSEVQRTSMYWICPEEACPHDVCPDLEVDKLSLGCLSGVTYDSSARKAAVAEVFHSYVEFGTENKAETTDSEVLVTLNSEIAAAKNDTQHELTPFAIEKVSQAKVEVVQEQAKEQESIKGWIVTAVIISTVLVVATIVVLVILVTHMRRPTRYTRAETEAPTTPGTRSMNELTPVPTPLAVV